MNRLDAIRRYVKGAAQNTLPLMITCERFEAFLQDYLAGDGLTGFERFKFEMHLFFCRECRDYLAAYRRAMTASERAYDEPEELAPPPPELVDAVMRARRAG